MPGSVPAELTSFVGREALLEHLVRLLTEDQVPARLVTLTGAGGSGKTRVAQQAAARLRSHFDDGVWFVPLAPIGDARLVARTIAQALDVRDAGASPVQSLQQYLRDRHLLLVLDNFEQILAAATTLPEVLAVCPRLRVLVTSRFALRVSGEREMAVQPLERLESMRLFVQRAAAVKSDFVPGTDTLKVIDEICRRLDDLPLAIELAAARIRLLDPQAMLDRLEHRLQFLTGGAADLPARQRTLRGALAWSYDLLTPAEQALFRTVSICVGGATLEAIQSLADGDVDVLEHADSLVARSLLRAVSRAPGDVRLTLLETTREFGLEQLAWTGELEPLRRRHADYYLRLAEEAEAHLWRPDAGVWLARLETEHDNMRAALEWALSSGTDRHGELSLRLGAALARFWWTRAHFGEGRRWLARALEASEVRSAARMKALHSAAWLSHFLHDSTNARLLLEESLSIARDLDDQWSIAWVLHVLGRVAYFDGDDQTARRLAEECMAIAERLGDQPLIGWALHLMGLAAHLAGDFPAAEALYRRSLDIREALGHREAVGVLCQLTGISAHRQRDFARARALYREYLAVARELGSTFHVSNAFGQFGCLAADLCQPERAARLLGAAAVFHESSQTRPIPLTEALVADGWRTASQALGEAAFSRALAQGRTLSSEDAIAEALAVEVNPTESARAGARASSSPLSARELEVAGLISRGMTNRQIAVRLVVTERTVAAHVEHILNKLGFASRTQVGVWAAERGIGNPTDVGRIGASTDVRSEPRT